MADAQDIYGDVFKDFSATCMARITGADATNIVQADITSAVYSIHLLDDQDADSRTAVTGHAAVSLGVVTAWIWDTLQTDARWTVDSSGYNFRWTLDVSSDVAFALAGRRYLIEFTLTPATGQTIPIRFRGNAI